MHRPIPATPENAKRVQELREEYRVRHPRESLHPEAVDPEEIIHLPLPLIPEHKEFLETTRKANEAFETEGPAGFYRVYGASEEAIPYLVESWEIANHRVDSDER